MEITINNSLATYKRTVKNYEDLVRLMIEIVKQFSMEDNGWEG